MFNSLDFFFPPSPPSSPSGAGSPELKLSGGGSKNDDVSAAWIPRPPTSQSCSNNCWAGFRNLDPLNTEAWPINGPSGPTELLGTTLFDEANLWRFSSSGRSVLLLLWTDERDKDNGSACRLWVGKLRKGLLLIIWKVAGSICKFEDSGLVLAHVSKSEGTNEGSKPAHPEGVNLSFSLLLCWGTW